MELTHVNMQILIAVASALAGFIVGLFVGFMSPS